MDRRNRVFIIAICIFVAGITSIRSIKQSRLPIRDCQISEFTCNNRRCISAEKYCDNIEDCGDGSDEPRFCSKCNRTYHGNVGVTYHMELHRPNQDKLPYVCQLTFTADGGMYGDIVQITILNGFTLGKFVSFTQKGCPDGHLEFNEADRVSVGGRFCGQSWGPAVFYSETRSLNLNVKLLKLLRVANTYNFDFRIDYKFLSKEESTVRYGGGFFIRPMLFNESFINFLNNRQQLQRHNSINDMDNKVNNMNMKSKAFDIYQEEFQSRFNNWYETALNFTSSPAPGSQQQQNGYGNSNSGKSVPAPARDKPRLKLYPKNAVREVKYYLGDLIHGTYCSRIFSNCDKKVCRLQSPNFPGTYPRNLTCYYAVRQHEVPPGKYALITVKQPRNNLVWIIAGNQTYASKSGDNGKPRPKLLQTWDECDVIQDFVTVYDGYTTRDPVLLKFCGGGQAVPKVTSSGPELLVEFTTAPFGTFNNLQPDTNLQAFNGFQLEVEVTFVDIQTPTYSKNKRLCEFWVRGTGHGVLENPKHSIAPNTTCLYHFQGTELTSRTMDQLQMPMRRVGNHPSSHSRFKVWFSLLKFDYAPNPEPFDENTLLLPMKEDCSGMMRIFDGQLREPPMCKDLDCHTNDRDQRLSRYGHNSTNVIARFCRGTVPRSCDHVIQNATYSRPCTLQESFLSTGEYATLELKVTESTALRPLNFRINYEFVDFSQEGAPIDGNDLSCNRKFVSSTIDSHHHDPILFKGNRNVFHFGRSGTFNMNCIYRFEAQRGERIRITVHKMMSGNRTCETRLDSDTQRSFCYGNNSAKLQIFERPWHDSIAFIRNCVCNSTNSSSASSVFPISYTSSSREVEVHFSAVNMSKYDDPDNLNFQATYEFLRPIPMIPSYNSNNMNHNNLNVDNVNVNNMNLNRMNQFDQINNRNQMNQMNQVNQMNQMNQINQMNQMNQMNLNNMNLNMNNMNNMNNLIQNNLNNMNGVNNNGQPSNNNNFQFSTMPPNICLDSKRKLGTEGTVSLNEGDIECKSRPWLIEPTTGKYLYVRFRGFYLSRHDPKFPPPINQSHSYYPDHKPECPTHSRVIVTTGDGVTVTACPLSDDWSNRHQVEVFSSGWQLKNHFQRFEASPALSIELIPDIYDYNEYLLTWLELSRRPPVAEGIEDCQFTCPELQACVNASIFCDGKVHCPSGSDESFIYCSRIMLLPAEALAVLSVLLIVLLFVLAIYVRRKIRRHCQSSSVLQKRLKSMSSVNTNTDTAVFDDKDFISSS